jgi:hypothetical protein
MLALPSSRYDYFEELPVDAFYFLKIQYFAKSAASFAVQSPFGFAFIFSHHLSLPTSGAQAKSISNIPTDKPKRKHIFALFITVTLLLLI